MLGQEDDKTTILSMLFKVHKNICFEPLWLNQKSQNEKKPMFLLNFLATDFVLQ